MEMKDIVGQAYHESRYHRGFHHTLFGIYFGLYLALVAFQLTNADKVCSIAEVRLVAWPVAAALYLLLPINLHRLVISYHGTIAETNRFIAAETRHLGAGAKDAGGFDHVTFQRYLSSSGSGRGHKFFLFNLWGLVILNAWISGIIIFTASCCR